MKQVKYATSDWTQLKFKTDTETWKGASALLWCTKQESPGAYFLTNDCVWFEFKEDAAQFALIFGDLIEWI